MTRRAASFPVFKRSLGPGRPPAPEADPIRRFVETLEALEGAHPPVRQGGRVRALDLFVLPAACQPRSPP